MTRRKKIINKPVLLIGGGPSLIDFDYNLITDDFFRMGTNYTFKKVELDWLHFADMHFFEDNWRDIVMMKHPISTCAHVDASDMLSAKGYWEKVGVKYYANHTRDADLDLGRNDFVCGSHSGHQAINVAIKNGAKEIYLLGFDMKSLPHRAEWHDEYHQHRICTVESMEEQSALWRKKMPTMLPFLKESGVKVYNSTPGSALECFPFESFSEAYPLETNLPRLSDE